MFFISCCVSLLFFSSSSNRDYRSSGIWQANHRSVIMQTARSGSHHHGEYHVRCGTGHSLRGDQLSRTQPTHTTRAMGEDGARSVRETILHKYITCTERIANLETQAMAFSLGNIPMLFLSDVTSLSARDHLFAGYFCELTTVLRCALVVHTAQRAFYLTL
jgi:hypothetical protein